MERNCDVFRKKYVVYVICSVFLLRGSMVSGPFTIDNKLKQVFGQSQYLTMSD